MAAIRNIKNRVKSIIRAKKQSVARKPVRLLKTRVKAARLPKAGVPAAAPAPVFGAQELAIENMKYYTSAPVKARRQMPQELSNAYGKDGIVLIARDPWWLYTFWEVTRETYDKLRNDLGEHLHSARRVLRVYDVSNIIFNGSNANRFFDVFVHHDSLNWYIDTGGPGRSWCVDFGLLLSDGRFITIVRSNTVTTPIDGPSWITDEEWMIPEEMFARLYGMGFGFGKSSPVGKAWQERMKRELFSGVLASPGITSVGSPTKKRFPKDRKFWLIVNTELIVYGATEPDAKVTVQGRPIRLRPDGTFSLRFALPDGKQVIPVKGVSADEVDEITVTPIVTRETR